MNNIDYVKSEGIWRAPDLEVKNVGLGEAILENLKQSNPEKIYEILHDRGFYVTVKDIRDQTITAAQNLLRLGVKKNDRVVFFSLLNLKITPLTFACYTIGAPVCFFETYLEEENVPQYLEMLDPTVIIYEEKFKDMVFKGLKGLGLLNLKHILSIDGEGQTSVDECLFVPPVDIENFVVPSIGDPNAQPAILAFTSGSTGLPKIVIHSHAMMRQGVYGRWQAKPGSVVMILSEIRWLCQVSIMMQPAFLDVVRVYSSTPPVELTGEFVMEIIDTHKVTHYFEVPKFYRTVLEAAERSQKPSALGSLKLAVMGGEGIGETFESYLKRITPSCEIGRCYGMTEMAGGIALSELASRKCVNGGILRRGCMVKIIDEDKNHLGPNEMGRICLKTSAPFLGYLKNKKANEESFFEDGWFNTEDLGIMDSDNLLNVFTRGKYVLRYANGEILMPLVVENIVNKFDAVHSSALVGKPSIENCKEDCGTIFVVLKDNSHSIYVENNLRDYLRQELSDEQRQIVKYLKVIEEFPTTTCFKINRISLKAMTDGSRRI